MFFVQSLVFVFAIVFVVLRGSVFDFIRSFLRTDSIIHKLLTCALCLGFWFGVVFSLFRGVCFEIWGLYWVDIFNQSLVFSLFSYCAMQIVMFLEKISFNEVLVFDGNIQK